MSFTNICFFYKLKICHGKTGYICACALTHLHDTILFVKKKKLCFGSKYRHCINQISFSCQMHLCSIFVTVMQPSQQIQISGRNAGISLTIMSPLFPFPRSQKFLSYSHAESSASLRRSELQKFTKQIPGLFFLKHHIKVLVHCKHGFE